MLRDIKFLKWKKKIVSMKNIALSQESLIDIILSLYSSLFIYIYIFINYTVYVNLKCTQFTFEW